MNTRLPLWLARFAALAAVLPLGACGESSPFDIQESLTVAMYGVLEAPTDAMGNAEPRFQTYTLEALSFTLSDGSVKDLYDSDPQEFRIINRAQIIYEAKLDELVSQTISRVVLRFAADVSGAGADKQKLAITLPNPTLSYAAPFTIPKAKSLRLEVKVQWKNTVTEDEAGLAQEMSPPSFVLAVSGG